jgi:hypothetical protein
MQESLHEDRHDHLVEEVPQCGLQRGSEKESHRTVSIRPEPNTGTCRADKAAVGATRRRIPGVVAPADGVVGSVQFVTSAEQVRLLRVVAPPA